jgi:hypothetical protein
MYQLMNPIKWLEAAMLFLCEMEIFHQIMWGGGADMDGQCC